MQINIKKNNNILISERSLDQTELIIILNDAIKWNALLRKYS